jgi:hypothetical protein
VKLNHQNGIGATHVAEEALPATGHDGEPPKPSGTVPFVPPKTTPKPLWKENGRLLFIGAGIVIVLLLLAFNGISRRANMQPKNSSIKPQQPVSGETPHVPDSVTPILETSRTPVQETDSSQVNPDQISHTATRQPKPSPGTTLGDVKPFDSSAWQPPPYQPAPQPAMAGSESAKPNEAAQTRSEHDALDKASLVFIRGDPRSPESPEPQALAPEIDQAVGLPPGTRLRARLESTINTAVRTPVVAVIEYNYEQYGEIAVPAGAKVFGRLESADRSGYIGIRFDSLLLPDGAFVPLEATATDLQLRPLRGTVEGKHMGKNILVRSFAGIGEIAATLVGRRSLNQPLSENDLLRERLANNVGLASDQTVSNLAITERIVVSMAADTEIYVVLQKAVQEHAVSSSQTTSQPTTKLNIEELRQLMQLQREFNQNPETKQRNE